MSGYSEFTKANKSNHSNKIKIKQNIDMTKQTDEQKTRNNFDTNSIKINHFSNATKIIDTLLILIKTKLNNFYS